MTHTTQTTARYVGIDVSKETLAVATYPPPCRSFPTPLPPVSGLPTNWRSSLLP